MKSRMKKPVKEAMENIERVINGDTDVVATVDVVTADAIDNDKAAKEHKDGVNKELDKRAKDSGVSDQKAEYGSKIKENTYTKKYTLDESLQDFSMEKLNESPKWKMSTFYSLSEGDTFLFGEDTLYLDEPLKNFIEENITDRTEYENLDKSEIDYMIDKAGIIEKNGDTYIKQGTFGKMVADYRVNEWTEWDVELGKDSGFVLGFGGDDFPVIKLN